MLGFSAILDATNNSRCLTNVPCNNWWINSRCLMVPSTGLDHTLHSTTAQNTLRSWCLPNTQAQSRYLHIPNIVHTKQTCQHRQFSCFLLSLPSRPSWMLETTPGALNQLQVPCNNWWINSSCLIVPFTGPHTQIQKQLQVRGSNQYMMNQLQVPYKIIQVPYKINSRCLTAIEQETPSPPRTHTNTSKNQVPSYSNYKTHKALFCPCIRAHLGC